ncbi:MAG: SMP-30/gluconolactonase/LRE family protein [Rhodospirillaceae bacterium]|nr:SMP-30/gluconolactonase/LRE family protein [Rhodospirillaceae bacterium]
MAIVKSSVWKTGFTFAESPRWHDGALWFSDFHDYTVYRVEDDGTPEAVTKVPGEPSGLGWLPDGRLLVVSMTDRKLMRVDPDGLKEHADLSGIATWHCNDMVVDAEGRAYVGNFGAAWGEDPTPADLARVDPDGTVSIAAEKLDFPNGCAISADGSTLLVAETVGGRLTAFDRDATGKLSNRRVWAEVPGTPDGICLDADGAVWVAAGTEGVLRVAEGGEILNRVEVTENLAVACMLGGDDRKTHFVMTTINAGTEELVQQRQSRIEIAEVAVSGAGWPG